MSHFGNTASVDSELDSEIAILKDGSRRLATMSIRQRRSLIAACIPKLTEIAKHWVEVTCRAKGIEHDSDLVAEEILVGPGTLLRYQQLLAGSLREIESTGNVRLPGRRRRNRLGWHCIPILPVKRLFDQLIFLGLKAEVWFQPESDLDSVSRPRSLGGDPENPQVAVVLGAGNSPAIPATDMLHKIFCDGESVLLKLNPVNEYLKPIFDQLFQPLIAADLLRVLKGGPALGEALVHHPQTDSIHITGSHITYDAILWGSNSEERNQLKLNRTPKLTKPITSELGNVSPWIVVPGKYSARQLKAQSDHIVASIVNNASFNCLATKMIVTSRTWPQRDEFLGLIEQQLNRIPKRKAYYPGAKERFERATGNQVDFSDETLPWTLIRDADPDRESHLFQEESFVCVCAETGLAAEGDRFLPAAVDFVNESLFGTLCASVTIPPGFRKRQSEALDQAISRLRYGAVCVNQWSGVMYGLMSPPWGGHPSSTVDHPESGVGHVHNTFFLQHFDKSVLWGPLVNFPKPVWLRSHRNARATSWALLEFYENPSWTRLPKLFFHALRG